MLTRLFTKILIVALAVVFGLALVEALLAWVAGTLDSVGDASRRVAEGSGAASLFGLVGDFARNPFLVLALLGAVALWWWRRSEKRFGGPEAAWRHARTRLAPAGLKEYALSHRAKTAFAAGAVLMALWWWMAESFAEFLLLFVPFAAVALYARRRARSRGELDSREPIVPTRQIRDPIWAFKRWSNAPGAYEVWHIAGHGYRSRHQYEHVLVSGQTGIGKGQQVLLAATAHSIACGTTSTVIGDPKGEVYEELKGLIARQPDERSTHVFSTLEEHADGICAGINPMCGPEETERFAASVVPDSDEPFWGESARDLVEATASVLGYPDDCVLRVGEALRNPGILQSLKEGPGGKEIAAVWQGTDDKNSESIRKSAAVAFKTLRQKRIARMFRPGREQARIDFTGRSVVFVCVDPTDATTTTRRLIAALLDHLYSLANKAGKRGGPGVEFIVDEAADFVSVQKFPEYLSFSRGNRVRWMLVLQNYSKLQSRLGGSREKLMDMLDSLSLKVFGRTGDDMVAEYASRASGKVRVRREGPQKKVPIWMLPVVGFKGRYLANRGRYVDEERSRIKPDHVRGLPEGEWFVVTGDFAERVVGVPWYSHYRDELIPEGSPNEPLDPQSVPSEDVLDGDAGAFEHPPFERSREASPDYRPEEPVEEPPEEGRTETPRRPNLRLVEPEIDRRHDLPDGLGRPAGPSSNGSSPNGSSTVEDGGPGRDGGTAEKDCDGCGHMNRARARHCEECRWPI